MPNDPYAPIIEGPDDFSVEKDTANVKISWNVTETNNESATLYTNNTPSSVPFSDNITIDVDTSAVTQINYTLEIIDKNGQVATDTVIVNVTPVFESVDPVVTGPSDFSTTQNTASVTINFTIVETNPVLVTLYTNGVPSFLVYSPSIIVPVDTSTVGVINYTLVVVDYFGNSGNDTVLVTINAPVEEGDDDDDDDAEGIKVPGYNIIIPILLISTLLLAIKLRKKRTLIK